MGAASKIEWTDSTFNPWLGCTKIARPKGAPSACDFCYAEKWAKRSGQSNGEISRAGVQLLSIGVTRSHGTIRRSSSSRGMAAGNVYFVRLSRTCLTIKSIQRGGLTYSN